MVPVTPELLDTIRYCRWGAYNSFVASIPALEKRHFLGFNTHSVDFSQTTMSQGEFRDVFHQFNTIISDTFVLQTFMALAIVSGNLRTVRYILGIPQFRLTVHDFFVCLTLGSVEMLRYMTWHTHHILFRRLYGSYSAAMVLAKSAHYLYVDGVDTSRHVPDFGEKLQFLVSMGMTMFEVDGCGGCNPYNIMIINRVPADIISIATRTLTKFQLNFVDQRFDSPLLLAINSENPFTIVHLVESGAAMFGDELVIGGDLRTRLSPMRQMIILSWRREIRRYLTFLELAHRGVTLGKEALYLKYRIKNFHMLYLLGEMGLRMRVEPKYGEYVQKDNHLQRAEWTGKIHQYVTSPRTLQSYARSAIHATLPPLKKIGPPLLSLVQRGFIPTIMFEYLLFKGEIMVAEEYRRSSPSNPLPGWYSHLEPYPYFDNDVDDLNETPNGLIFPPRN